MRKARSAALQGLCCVVPRVREGVPRNGIVMREGP
jgi:hypothetical protein